MTKPRIEAYEAQLAAQKEAAKAGLLAANSPPAVAAGPEPAARPSERKKEEPKNNSVLDKVAAKLMGGSIMDFDVYERGDTIPARGGEVQLPASMNTVPGPPVEKKLTVAGSR